MSLNRLVQDLDVTFQDKNLFFQALTHKSFLNENRYWQAGSNERLEFLGDAVIELIVSKFLFIQYPDKQEGELTALRSKLVSNSTLYEAGEKVNLFDCLFLSRGQQSDTSNRVRERLTACAFEAIVGALYLDQGYEVASGFVHKKLLQDPDTIFARSRDSKSLLQERAQAVEKVTPEYKTLEEDGADHDKQFVVGVFFGMTLIAKGKGPSKKLAEEQAAKTALSLKNWCS